MTERTMTATEIVLALRTEAEEHVAQIQRPMSLDQRRWMVRQSTQRMVRTFIAELRKDSEEKADKFVAMLEAEATAKKSA